MRATILVVISLLSASGCAFDGSALWPQEEHAGAGGAEGATGGTGERATPRPDGATAVEGQTRRPLVRPLMIIAPDVDRAAYEPTLYTVASETLGRQPNAVFDVVAVAPESADSSRRGTGAPAARDRVERQADRVRDALMTFGLPPTRIAMASQTADPGADGEVRVYTRY